MQDQNKKGSLEELHKEELIGPLLKLLYSKPAPSKTLNDITFNRLIELESLNIVNHRSLWIGAIIADLFIYEARKAQDLKTHLPLAIEFAKQFIKEKKILNNEGSIILEIIETHHGGAQYHIESKLFKIADCHKFLEPAGLIDLISDYYKNEGNTLSESITLANNKLYEKFNLIQDIKELDRGFDIEASFSISRKFLERAQLIASSLK